jgi:hypothetical protein
MARRAVRGEPVFPYAAAQRAAALVGQKMKVKLWWVWKESNLRPPFYQNGVLPLNYTPFIF